MGTVFEHDELGARDPICERAAGVAGEHIYAGKRTGATMDRDGLTALPGFARPGDRINLLTLDGSAATCGRP